ncbi:hypothetical protein WJX72_005804 [[Myrmecia] bisecta]|uniref:Uncharacterized protein n=1 Tax=[Myrmecia] bisecta TaxID=41462 RepID=A0AAW1R6L4_9CHLO
MHRKHVNPAEALLKEDYLPEEEQAEVVRSLEQQQARQSWGWKLVWAAVAITLASGFFWLAVSQISEPWGLRPHSHFRGVLSTRAVAMADVATALCFCLWAVVLLWSRRAGNGGKAQATPDYREGFIALGSLVYSALVAVFWSWQLYAAQTKEEPGWDCLWLPGLPLLFAVLVLYVHHTETENVRQLKALRQSMYTFKTA